MLLCLANIGDVLADIFRFIYAKICCCGCCWKKDKNKVVQIKPTAKEPEGAWNTEKAKVRIRQTVVVVYIFVVHNVKCHFV